MAATAVMLMGTAVPALAHHATSFTADCDSADAHMEAFPEGTQTVTFTFSGDVSGVVTDTFEGPSGDVSAAVPGDIDSGDSYQVELNWTADGGPESPPTVGFQGGDECDEGPSDEKVELCHATGSETNPFVLIEVSASGAFHGHLGDSHQDGNDIIPPFTYQGETYSQNWDAEGQAVYESGCEALVPAAEVTVKADRDCSGGSLVTITNTGSTEFALVYINGQWVEVTESHSFHLDIGDVAVIELPDGELVTVKGAKAKDCDEPEPPVEEPPVIVVVTPIPPPVPPAVDECPGSFDMVKPCFEPRGVSQPHGGALPFTGSASVLQWAAVGFAVAAAGAIVLLLVRKVSN